MRHPHNYLGSTDLMYLTHHKGKLWAGTSVRNDNPQYWPNTGPQKLVKESSISNWKVDTSRGTGYQWTETLFGLELFGTNVLPPAAP